MELFLHPLIAPTRQLWIRVVLTETAGKNYTLRWYLNGSPVSPEPFGEGLGASWSVEQLEIAPKPKEKPLAYSRTGVFSLEVAPSTQYLVRCEAFAKGDEGTLLAYGELQTRSLPERIEPGETFHVLLASCYYRPRDRGLIHHRIRRITGIECIDASLFLGDQVYLDLPTFENFENDRIWLAQRFEQNYLGNWTGSYGLAPVLQQAPGAFCPDDHEFWNNYPHAATVIENSYGEQGRENWTRAACSLLKAFQIHPAHKTASQADVHFASEGNPGGYLWFDIPPMSFFLADTRSKRKPNWAFAWPFLQPLQEWIEHINQKNLYGAFVTGQSLFVEAMNWQGYIYDWELPNYGDYYEITRVLCEAKNTLLCITGDVHWGRIVRARDKDHTIFEIISSPVALVENQLDELPWKAGPLPWPYHKDADPPPEQFPVQADGPGWDGPPTAARRYQCEQYAQQRGDQVAILSCQRVGQRMRFKVTYWPNLATEHLPQSIELEE